MNKESSVWPLIPENVLDLRIQIMRSLIDEFEIVSFDLSPRHGPFFEALDVGAEGILVHRRQGVLNARLILCRQFLKLFLRGAGDLEVPGHCVPSH
jgi:hypothetical protein